MVTVLRLRLNRLKRKIIEILLNKVSVILCTPRMFACYQNSNRKEPCTIIIDEASCVTFDAILPIIVFNPSRLIVAGDECQLPPFSFSGVSGRSVLELLSRSDLEYVKLGKVRRCAPEIFRWSRYMFYPHATCTYKPLIERIVGPESVKVNPVALIQNPNEFNQERVGNSFKNEKEASAVLKYAAGFKHKTVVIITPYRAQMAHLRILAGRKIEIFSADTFQGEESEVVVVSLVRSGGDVGFLRDPKRINMIMTRAKSHIAIFGHFDTLRTDTTWKTFVDVYANRIIPWPSLA